MQDTNPTEILGKVSKIRKSPKKFSLKKRKRKKNRQQQQNRFHISGEMEDFGGSFERSLNT